MRWVTFRKLSLNDLTALGELARSLPLLEEYSGCPWNDEKAAGIIALYAEHCFVALQKKRLVGFIIAMPENIQGDSRKMSIQWLGFTDPDEDPHTGSKLIEQLRKHALSLDINELTIALTTFKETTLNFYTDNGFSESTAVKILKTGNTLQRKK